MADQKRKRRPSRRLLESVQDEHSPSVPVKKQRVSKRVSKASQSQPPLDYLAELQKERTSTIQEAVHELNEGDARKILSKAAERDPWILREIMNASASVEPTPSSSTSQASSPPQPPDSPRPPDSPTAAPRWCICGHCVLMQSDVENKCCRQHDCVAESREFQLVVLDPLVLYIFKMYRQDIFALHNVGQGELCKQNRHAAYRVYTLWKYGKLAAGDRRVIPSCVVTKIRETYPDTRGVYTGFVTGRLG